MRLGDIKKLNEARYDHRAVYFVQAFDPEDGDISTYAGPFPSEAEANKFANHMISRDKQYFGERVDWNDLPAYHVEKLLPPDAFIEEINQHVEQFADDTR